MKRIFDDLSDEGRLKSRMERLKYLTKAPLWGFGAFMLGFGSPFENFLNTFFWIYLAIIGGRLLIKFLFLISVWERGEIAKDIDDFEERREALIDKWTTIADIITLIVMVVIGAVVGKMLGNWLYSLRWTLGYN